MAASGEPQESEIIDRLTREFQQKLAAAQHEAAEAHKTTFFVRLDSIAAAASEGSASDVSRRGALQPTTVSAADFLSVPFCPR